MKLELTKTEYELLAQLMEQTNFPGKIIMEAASLKGKLDALKSSVKSKKSKKSKKSSAN